MHDGERLQLHHMCGDQLIWVILAQSNEVAVRMLVGMQSSEDWLGLRIHFFPEHIDFSAGLLECLLDNFSQNKWFKTYSLMIQLLDATR